MASVADVVKRYQQIFSQKLNFKLTGNKLTLGPEGEGNTIFYLGYLLQNKTHFIEFLKEIGLLKSVIICGKCNQEMRLLQNSSKKFNEEFIWRCKTDKGITRSIRFGSMFSESRLSMEEVFLICYELVRGAKTDQIKREYGFTKLTLSMYRQLINTVILDYLLQKSEKIGGPGKIVDLVETRIPKRRYQDKQNVIAGIERETGRLFFTSVPDKSAESFQRVILQWIEKGTVICSDPWDDPDEDIQLGCDYLRTNHNVIFLDPKKYGPGYPKESCVNTYEGNSYGSFLVFKRSCYAKKENVFICFLEVAREVNWIDSKHNLRVARESGTAKAQKSGKSKKLSKKEKFTQFEESVESGRESEKEVEFDLEY